MAQVRIISVDFYMNPPIGGLDCMYSEFRGCSTHQVPVIRIFGITSTGKKACLHVHGVFPYIYIPYDGKDPPDGLMYQIASNLDKAINISLGQASSNAQHVYKILLVSGIPFYGYHKREHQFFKLYFYNPLILKKACTLLQNGAVLGKIFQPHEAHIPYILQFMIDYNLHGMSFANFSQIKYRFDSARGPDVPADLISPPNLAKQSVCEIEADAFAQHILNRLDIAEGKLTVNPGIKALWEDEMQRRRNKDEESQISPCLTQTRVKMPPTATHVAFKGVLEERLAVAAHKEAVRGNDIMETSVYPAETPSTQSLLNASCIEEDQVLSSDDTLTPDVAANSTMALDEDAQSLLELLKSLRNNVDKDSILSQVQRENDSEEEEEGIEMDLSLPLGSMQTPRKPEEYTSTSKAAEDSDPDEFNDSYFDATVCIPQLDGSSEVTSLGNASEKVNRYNLRSRSRNLNNVSPKKSTKCKESLKLPDEKKSKFKEAPKKNLNSVSEKQTTSKLIQDCHVRVADLNRNSLLTDVKSHIGSCLDSSKLVDRNLVNVSDDLKTKMCKANRKQAVVELVNIEESLKKLIRPFKLEINQELDYFSSKSLRSETVNFFETHSASQSESAPLKTNNLKKESFKNTPKSRNESVKVENTRMRTQKLRRNTLSKKLRLDLNGLFKDKLCSHTKNTKKSPPDLKVIQNLNAKAKHNDNSIKQNLQQEVKGKSKKYKLDLSVLLNNKVSSCNQSKEEIIDEADDNKSETERKLISDEPQHGVTLLEGKSPQNKIGDESCFYSKAGTVCETNDLSPDWMQQFTKPKVHCDNNLLAKNKSKDGLVAKKLQKINNNVAAVKSAFGTSQNEITNKEMKFEAQVDNKSGRSEKKRTLKKSKVKPPRKIKAAKHEKVKITVSKSNNAKSRFKHQKWSDADFLNPKFNVVPAPRPYTYVPKFPKKQTNHESAYAKILRDYPNTVWSFCQSSSSSSSSSSKKADESNAITKKKEGGGSIIILSDYQLADHEKFDPSLFPVKNSNVSVIIAPNTNNNNNDHDDNNNNKRSENVTPAFYHPPHEQETLSKDTEIVNELSSLYDEIEMYNSSFNYCNFKQEGTLETPERNWAEFDIPPESFFNEKNLIKQISFEGIETIPTPKGCESFLRSSSCALEQDLLAHSSSCALEQELLAHSSSCTLEQVLLAHGSSCALEQDILAHSSSCALEQDLLAHETVNDCFGPSPPSKSTVNKSVSPSQDFKSYMKSLSERYDLLMDSQGKSWKDFYDSLKPITQDSHVSMRLILERLRTRERKLDGRILVRNRTCKPNKRVTFSDFIEELNESGGSVSDCECASKQVDFNGNKLSEGAAFLGMFDSCVATGDLICLARHSSSTKNKQNNATEEGGCNNFRQHDVGINECDLFGDANKFQYRYLDGTNDSSGGSSEEDVDWQQRGTKKRQLRSSKTQTAARAYTPLPVTFSSPSKSSAKSLSNRGLQDQINEMSSVKLSKNDEKNADDELNRPQQTNNSDNSQARAKHKRLLTFAEIGTTPPINIINKTTVEDTVACRYKKSSSRKKLTVKTTRDCESVNLKTKTSDKVKCKEINNQWVQANLDFNNEKCSSELNFENSDNSPQYSDDLFSPEAEPADFDFHTKASSSTSNELTPYQQPNQKDFEVSHTDDGGGLIVSAPKYNPPSPKSIAASLGEYNIPEVQHQQPFYGDCNDVTGAVEVGHNVLKIPGRTPADLPDFESFTKGIGFAGNLDLSKKELRNYKLALFKDSDCVVTPARLPPTRAEVELWLKTKLETLNEDTIVQKERVKIRVPQSPNAKDENDDSCEALSLSPCTPIEEASRCDSPVIKKNKALVKHKMQQRTPHTNSCRISGASFNNTHDFAVSLNNLKEAKAIVNHQFISVLTMEVLVQTRGDFEPDPQLDALRAIFYSIHHDAPKTDDVTSGAFVVDALPHSPTKLKRSIAQGTGISGARLKLVDSEMTLISEFVAFIKDCDPDVLIGYEIEMHSWGYLIDRGYVLGLNLVSTLSKVPGDIMLLGRRTTNDEKPSSELRLTGRIVIDFWRLMRHEIALQSYTFESIVYHVLHRRVPLHSPKELSFWWNHPTAIFRHQTFNYLLFRVEAVLKIIDQLDLINRTSELARLFGIQFYEVLSRGSQFRVESMMLRLAKPLNYIPVSPNVQQRAKMRAPESLPLILEPESKFYADPVVVLDFQSLYPSMIIAYNYCFSTCLGRIEHLGQGVPFEFGASQLKISRARVSKLLKGDGLNFSPCGVGFVKSEVRQGILPRMLQEILDTRLMVKKSMKENAQDKVLQKVLHARQLGLKLIANVTYGYTAANFSGRMPAIEVGDSVVSKGRETLQRAIKLVESNSEWGARVVYGDTDSLFVLVAGKSREEAFRIGGEIASAVTNENPSPVKLKLEKVFHPCILQTKKRYVGYMYESPDQKHPEFCAKGIETVRRDGCPAVSKMLEKCLKMLFDTRDVSAIRKYVVRQFSKLLTGRVSIQDLTFAKEYRGASGYRPGACVPALELARKWTAQDKRKEPRRGERVPYVIINGPPGLPLIRLVRSPRELLSDTALRPNAQYYITKVIIPPINRCFNLIGADLNIWFNAMPRKQIQYLPSSSPSKGKKSTISQYFSSTSCALCGQQTQTGLCVKCGAKPQESAVLLHEKLRIWEKNHFETNLMCQSCCGRAEDLVCISLDCPVLYRKAQTEKDLQQSTFVRHLISSLPEDQYD